MTDELEALRGFAIKNETNKLKRNVIIYAIINMIILFIGILAAIFSLIGYNNPTGSEVVAGNSIFMSTLEIIVILIILKMFSNFINDDNASQLIFAKSREMILDGKYDEEIKSSYRPSRVYKSFNTLLIIHICIVILDVILSISLSDYRNWVILTTSILNMSGSLLELFLLINISKFLTLRELESRKCVEILSKVNNMKDDYQVNDIDLNENIPGLLVKMSLVLCCLLGIFYIATAVIFIVSNALNIMEFSPVSIISMLVGGGLDIYLIYFLRGYFKYQRDFTVAIKAAIEVLKKDRKSYIEGYNNIFK